MATTTCTVIGRGGRQYTLYDLAVNVSKSYTVSLYMKAKNGYINFEEKG